MKNSVALSKPSCAEKKRPRIHAELWENSVSLGSFIGEENLVIGRSTKADLIVPTAPVSQIHAMIRLNKNAELCLYDLGSENGTFLNGKRIVEQSILSGTTFQIGTYAIKVNLVDLAPENAKFHDNEFFWQNQCSAPDVLMLVHNRAGHLYGETQVSAGKSISEKKCKKQLGIAIALSTSQEGNELVSLFNLPKDCTAEVYDSYNSSLRVIEEGAVKFSHLEKVRLVANYAEEETFLYWREQGSRSSRRALDADAETLWKTAAASLVFGLILATISYLTGLKKEKMEEALIPKSSYERTTMQSAPAPKGDNTEASAEKSAEASAPTKPNQAPSKPTTATNISSALSKMFNAKTSISAEALNSAVGKTGAKSVRSLSAQSEKIEQIGGGGSTGVAANASALAASVGKGGSGKVGGKGFGNGTGLGVGSGGTGFGGKGFDLNLGGDEAEAVGGLDKALIAAVVQANIGQIKHCYERQLIVDPNIFGKVVAGWTINKEGLVSATSVKKTTMNNAPVENCILSKIKTWQFPKPNGGGQVLVTYPFLFKSLN